MTDDFIRVKIPGDIAQLMKLSFHLSLEPPYWYLRCKHCNQRFHLPWDPRLRTQEAHEILLAHGKQHGGTEPAVPGREVVPTATLNRTEPAS
jgi:hypothetical protein